MLRVGKIGLLHTPEHATFTYLLGCSGWEKEDYFTLLNTLPAHIFWDAQGGGKEDYCTLLNTLPSHIFWDAQGGERELLQTPEHATFTYLLGCSGWEKDDYCELLNTLPVHIFWDAQGGER